jgi:hypothetical protein
MRPSVKPLSMLHQQAYELREEGQHQCDSGCEIAPVASECVWVWQSWFSMSFSRRASDLLYISSRGRRRYL